MNTISLVESKTGVSAASTRDYAVRQLLPVVVKINNTIIQLENSTKIWMYNEASKINSTAHNFFQKALTDLNIPDVSSEVQTAVSILQTNVTAVVDSYILQVCAGRKFVPVVNKNMTMATCCRLRHKSMPMFENFNRR